MTGLWTFRDAFAAVWPLALNGVRRPKFVKAIVAR